MNSRTTARFRAALANLPNSVQARARKAYRLFRINPYHPGLRFKHIHAEKPIYSVRISSDYRALGVQEEDMIVWFWIGSHSDYDRRTS